MEEQKVRCTCDVTLVGVVETEPELYYSTAQDDFYLFYLGINRLSSEKDVLPVVITKNMLASEGSPVELGKTVKILGTYKSYNQINDDNTRRLILNVYVSAVEETDEKHVNNIKMKGYLCKIGNLRETPKGRTIIDLLIAVNRSNRRSDYIPLICWSSLATLVSGYHVGALISIEGRIQSRKYNKALPDGTVEERIAYEVSVNNFSKQKKSPKGYENADEEDNTEEADAEVSSKASTSYSYADEF